MSRVPMGSNLGEAGWSGFSDKLLDQWQIVPQGISAEVIAEERGLAREALDLSSAASCPSPGGGCATDDGSFENEIAPIEVGVRAAVGSASLPSTRRRGATPRSTSSPTLQPAFKLDGVVTAGNSSSIVYGSAAMLLAERCSC